LNPKSITRKKKLNTNSEILAKTCKKVTSATRLESLYNYESTCLFVQRKTSRQTDDKQTDIQTTAHLAKSFNLLIYSSPKLTLSYA